MYTKEQLDFAYKYPFSDEAREIIRGLNANEIEQRYLIIGKARIDEALQNDKVEYRESDYGRLDFVVGYAYARMLVSSLKNLGVITKYAKAEAKRACDALAKDTDSNMIRLAKELDLGIKRDGESFSIIFTQFLSHTLFPQSLQVCFAIFSHMSHKVATQLIDSPSRPLLRPRALRNLSRFRALS